MKEVWNYIFQNSTVSVQTLRDNAGRFHKDKSLVNRTEVRDGNDIEPEVMQIALEPVRIVENVK